jgi:hypothetical protein
MKLVSRLGATFAAINAGRRLLTIGLVVLGLTLQALGLAHSEVDTRWCVTWRMFTQTAPLTLSFMLMFPLLFEGIRARGAERFFMVVVAPCVVLIIAASIAVWFGHLNMFDQPPLIKIQLGWPLDIVIRGINLLGAYYSAYGRERFWSSLVLGVVLLLTCAGVADAWKSR